MNDSHSPSLITSVHNPRMQRWRRLLESKGIAQFGQFLISGERLVRETLAQQEPRCLELIFPPGSTHGFSGFPRVQGYSINQHLFDLLDIFGTGFPLLVCRAPEFPVVDLNIPPEGLEVLCPLGDPVNVGAVIRTAVAMGANKVILLEEAAHPLHPKSVRSASGTLFAGTLCRGPSIRDLTTQSQAVGLDLTGESLPTFVWPSNIRILVGEEGKGVGPLNVGPRVTIGMSSGVESLNATMAAGIAMYAYRVQHPLKLADHH